MEIVEKIIEQVDNINKEKDFRKVTLRNEEFMENMTDGGGEMTGFYKNGVISKVYQRIGVSYGIYFIEYYYEDNMLIFVTEKFDQYAYDSLNSIDYSKTENILKGLYYFDSGKVIYSTSTGHDRFEEDNSDPAIYYSQESERNLELIKNKMYK
jgi:hypothetical protein